MALEVVWFRNLAALSLLVALVFFLGHPQGVYKDWGDTCTASNFLSVLHFSLSLCVIIHLPNGVYPPVPVSPGPGLFFCCNFFWKWGIERWPCFVFGALSSFRVLCGNWQEKNEWGKNANFRSFMGEFSGIMGWHFRTYSDPWYWVIQC